MDKYLKRKIFFSIILFFIFACVLPNHSIFFGSVYADKLQPGTIVEIPTNLPQVGASYEYEDRVGRGDVQWSSGTNQLAMYNKWVQSGKKDDAEYDHCAYIEVAGTKRYLIAVSPIFGETGDYIDVYVNQNGVETVYPFIIGDVKGSDSQFIWTDGKHYGHDKGVGCEICELMVGAYDDSQLNRKFMNALKGVTKIQNGGSFLEHPEGPIGLNGAYGSSTSDSGLIDFTDFWGALKAIFGGIWDAICVEFENLSSDRQDITTQYDLNDKDDSTGNQDGTQFSGVGVGASASASEIIEKATKWMEDIANDNSHGYRIDNANRYGQNGDYSCSGLNIKGWMYAGANIHEIGGEGVYGSTGVKMYKNAGFREIFTNSQGNLKSEWQIKDRLQRGDVLLYSGHTAQYVGNNKKVEACGDMDGKFGDSSRSGGEIAINPISKAKYPVRVLRYYGNSQ